MKIVPETVPRIATTKARMAVICDGPVNKEYYVVVTNEARSWRGLRRPSCKAYENLQI